VVFFFWSGNPMRNNQPVSQKEIAFPKGRVIISRTDLKGRITMVNDAFVAISGYSTEELIGQPHNLLRHPDMPSEAFRDLWATVKAGRSWSAIVKNRCKNGDHYWIRANVTPLPDGSGYMSVRTEASRNEIETAQALYAQMQHSTLHLSGGQIARGGLIGWFTDKNRRLLLTHRLWAVLILTVGLLVWGAGSALSSQQTLLEELQKVTSVSNTGSSQNPALIATIEKARISHSQSMGIVIGAVVLGLVLFSLTLAYLSRTLRKTQNTIHQIATSGDLSQPLVISHHDELGRILTEVAVMRSKLHEMIGDLVDRVEGIGPSVLTMKTTVDGAAGMAANQSKAASSMASAIEQLSVSVEQVRDHANESRSLSEQSSQLAREGGATIMRAADEIQAIAAAVQTAVGAVRSLEGHSARISNIVQVIRDIADQTNLLALNAAIEAARAGESGRGFAVVADEVRKLAERTSVSTLEIAEMVSLIQSGTSDVAHGMEESVNRVTHGVDLAHEAGKAVNNIQESIVSSAGTITGIFDALKEQAMATHLIAQRVEEIAQSAEHGAASSGEASEAAHTIHALTDELRTVAHRFTI
jgi:aerotaxis receptor